MLAQLIPVAGGTPIVIDRDITVVGRNRQLCDLHVNHSSVSKVHCIIAKTDGLLFIRDLGSSNGTRVNGQKVVRGALLPGDQISFAAIKFKVHLGPDVEAPQRSDQTEVIPAYRTAPPGKPVSKPAKPGLAARRPAAPTPVQTPPPQKKPTKAARAEPESDSDVRLLNDDDLEDSDEIEILE